MLTHDQLGRQGGRVENHDDCRQGTHFLICVDPGIIDHWLTQIATAATAIYDFNLTMAQKLSREKETVTMKPTVIVAEDHRLVAEGIVKILEKDYTVLAIPTDGHAFIEAVETFRPDLALVDISLPLLNGLDACRHLKKSCHKVKIIILRCIRSSTSWTTHMVSESRDTC